MTKIDFLTDHYSGRIVALNAITCVECCDTIFAFAKNQARVESSLINAGWKSIPVNRNLPGWTCPACLAKKGDNNDRQDNGRNTDNSNED